MILGISVISFLFFLLTLQIVESSLQKIQGQWLNNKNHSFLFYYSKSKCVRIFLFFAGGILDGSFNEFSIKKDVSKKKKEYSLLNYLM